MAQSFSCLGGQSANCGPLLFGRLTLVLVVLSDFLGLGTGTGRTVF